MLSYSDAIMPMWEYEKLATAESIVAAKEEALTMLAAERERVMRMSRDEAIRELVLDRNVDGREDKVRSVSDNGILSMV